MQKSKLATRWAHIEERLADPSVKDMVRSNLEASAAFYILGLDDEMFPRSLDDVAQYIAHSGIPTDGPGLVVGSTKDFPISILGINRGPVPGGSRVQLLIPNFSMGDYTVTRNKPLPRTLGEIPGQIQSDKRLYWTTYGFFRTEWTAQERERLAELKRDAHTYVDPHHRKEQR